jgi:hypothetical protein
MRIMSIVLLGAIGGVACHPDPAAETTGGSADAGYTDVASEPAVDTQVPLPQPAFDDEGIPLPDSKLALGVAVPRGFERNLAEKGTVIYGGPISAEKLVAFYRRYTDCMIVSEVSRGWRFEAATPRPPGDPSRSVDLTVLKRGPQYSEVVVFDRMAQSKVAPPPDGGPATYEELYELGHKGTGSSAQPIPGTY